MSDATVWIEDEWDDFEDFQPRHLLGIQGAINRMAWSMEAARRGGFPQEVPSVDEAPGMTLGELLGDIDALLKDTDDG